MIILFLINLFCSLFLCGLIWLVQLVHYPMFHGISKEIFTSQMEFHQKKISLIVVPVMIGELVTAAALSIYSDTFQYLHIAGLIIVISIWLTTFFFHVPQHSRLTSGYDSETINRLVSTNWIRTFLWTAKSLLSVYILYLML